MPRLFLQNVTAFVQGHGELNAEQTRLFGAKGDHRPKSIELFRAYGAANPPRRAQLASILDNAVHSVD